MSPKPKPGATPAQIKLIALEARVKADVGNGFLANVKQLRQDLANESPDIREKLFALVAPEVEADARTAVEDAFEIGRSDALRLLANHNIPDLVGITVKSGDLPVATKSVTLVEGLDTKAADAVTMARRLATAGADPDTYLAPIFAAANSINRAITSSINGAGNEGTLGVSDLAELPTVWVAETDACVECLAYSGQVCDPGDEFPGGLTYGAVSYQTESLEAPPLHPNCRCTIEPLGDQSFADALRREADRSVLRGFSLDSESNSTRIGAAERLLAKGVVAPKSVIAYAQKAVDAGSFPTRNR